jgi:hypothetical protein
MDKIRCVEYFAAPAIWEEGGRNGGEGYAVVITDGSGEAKEILRKEYVTCGRHGLFYIEKGDYIVKAMCRKDASPPTVVEVYQVKRVDFDDEEDSYVAEVELIAKWGKDLEGTIPSYLTYAIQAAEQKAMCPLCDHVHFGKNSTSVNVEKKDGKFRVTARCAGIIPDVQVVCETYNDAMEVLHRLWDQAHDANMRTLRLCLQVWDAEKRLIDLRKESM